MKVMKIGAVDCGNISDIYFCNIAKFDNLELVAVSAAHLENAKKKAEIYGVKALGVDELINSSEIEAVLNLTNPAFHYQ